MCGPYLYSDIKKPTEKLLNNWVNFNAKYVIVFKKLIFFKKTPIRDKC